MQTSLSLLLKQHLLAAQIFSLLFLPFKSCPLVRGIVLEKKVEIALLYTYISVHGLLWLSFVNFYLSLWSSEAPAGSDLSLAHVSFTQSLVLYMTNVFRIKPLKEKPAHFRWHKQDKHTKSNLREFYFLLSNIRNKDILAPVLEHQASTMEVSAYVTGLTKMSVKNSCTMIDSLLIEVGESFAFMLKRLSKASHN